MRAMRKAAIAFVLLPFGMATVSAGLLTRASPAEAASAASCTTTSGVTVVVDFSPFGGQITKGCAPGAPATGLDAMTQAGFSVTGTQRYGDAFVCRIDGLPTESQDPCVDTPPADAYWAYFHALQGATSWTYSNLGAASYQPPPGSVDAWTFGSGEPPPFAPSEVLPTPSSTTTTVQVGSPQPTSGATPTTDRAPGSQKPVDSPATGSAPTPSPSTGPTAGPNATSAHAKASAATTTTGAPRSDESSKVPKIVDVSPSQQRAAAAADKKDRSGEGSPALFIAGAVVVAGFAATASTLAIRRRRSDARST